MGKLKVLCFSISADGYGAGPAQSLDNPMGEGGMALHQWFISTKTFQQVHGEMLKDFQSEGETGVDDLFAVKGFENIGAWILGRNMFGPIRGSWGDFSWRGWWGDNPPYHTPVYVLTHHARKPLEMEGGTTFYFVTEGIEAALEMARESAKGKDIRLGGGAETIRQYLKAKLIDEMHLAVSPVFLGTGEGLLHGVNLPELGYECTEYIPSEKAAHLLIKRKTVSD